MNKLSVRQQFIKNCFGEIKELISLGITTERNTQLLKHSQRRAQLFDKVRDTLDPDKRLRTPFWELKNVEDKKVFDAIVTFYLICDYHKGSDSISEALDYFASIAAYRIFPPSLENEGAQSKTHQFIRSILTAFGVINNTKEGNGNGDDAKMIDLINKYGSLFSHGDNNFYTSQLLHFNRHIRNTEGHSDKEFEPRLRQEVAVQFLYNYIIVVYMLKFVLNRNFNTQFGKYYKEHKKDYNIPVRIEKVSNPTTLEGEGEAPIPVNADGDYSLSPFTKYRFAGFDSTFDLNEYCYNVTITPPSHTNYGTVIDLPQEGLDADLKEQLKTLQDTINKKIGESPNLDDMRNVVGKELEKVGGLFDVCNALQIGVADLKTQQDDVKKELIKILEGCHENKKSLEILDKKIDELCNNKLFKDLVENIGGLYEKIDKVGEDVGIVKDTTTTILTNQEKEKHRKKSNRIFVSIIAFMVVLLGILYFFRVDVCHSLYNKYHWEYCCELLYDNGDPNIAYEYAQLQEQRKNFPKAAEWYRKAIRRYEEVVNLPFDTLQAEVFFRLAWMYSQAKGGKCDNMKALEYASKIKHTTKGMGIYAMLYSFAGNLEEIEDLIAEMGYVKQKDDYMLLAEALWQLNSPNLPQKKQKKELYVEACNAIKRLTMKIGSSVRGEALTQLGLGILDGLPIEEDLYYNMYEGLGLLQAAANEENHIMSQVALADRCWKMGDLKTAKHYYGLAVSNGFTQVLPDLILLARQINDPQEYIDSLLQIQECFSHDQDSLLVYRDQISHRRAEGRYSRAVDKEAEFLAKAMDHPYEYRIDNAFFEEYMRDILSSDTDLSQILPDTTIYSPNDTSIIYYNKQDVIAYLTGIKYAQGYGIERNQAKADSLIQIAAENGLLNAIYTWGNLLFTYKQNTLAAISELSKIENEDARAQELLSIIYADIDKSRSKAYLQRITDETRLFKPVQEFDEWSEHHNLFTAEDTEEIIHWIRTLEGYLCRNNFSDKSLSTEIAGRLAILYMSVGAVDQCVRFYTGISMNPYLNGEGYYELKDMAAISLQRGNLEKAKEYYETFCNIYFSRHDIEKKMDYEKKSREEIVGFMNCYFKGMAERVARNTGKDVSKGLEDNYFIESDDKGNRYVNPPTLYRTILFPPYPF